MRKRIITWVIICLVTLVSCNDDDAPVLRVADFNMPNTYFEFLEYFDTGDAFFAVEEEPEEEPRQLEFKQERPRYNQPAGHVEVRLQGSLLQEFQNFEYNFVSGGAFFEIVISGTTWHRDVGSDEDLTQLLIDSMEGGYQWDRIFRWQLNTENVNRISPTIVRVSVPEQQHFTLHTTEQVSITIPAECLVGVDAPIICRDLLYIRHGRGTHEHPFPIIEARDFEALRVYPDKVFRLDNSFDMSDYEWKAFSFSGTLYGNGRTVSNLHVHTSEDASTGLFSVLTGHVSNLHLHRVQIIGEDDVGAFAGINQGVITDCFVTGSVEGRHRVGGVVGTNRGVVNATNVIADIEGLDHVGGIAGWAEEGSVQGCCSNAMLTGRSYVGGIVGSAVHSGIVTSNLTTDGYIHITGPTLATAGRIAGRADINTLRNNAATRDYHISFVGVLDSQVRFGNEYNIALTSRHGENFTCTTSTDVYMESYCDTGRKTYPDTNELFFYDLHYHGLNALIYLENAIWNEAIIKSEEGLQTITRYIITAFRNKNAAVPDFAISPENIQVYKNVLILHSNPIREFRAQDDFALEIFLPTSLMTTWSRENRVHSKEGIPYLHVMGTQSSPYPIRTEKELFQFHEDPYSYYILKNNIILYEADEWVWPERVIGDIDFNGYRILHHTDIGREFFVAEGVYLDELDRLEED